MGELSTKPWLISLPAFWFWKSMKSYNDSGRSRPLTQFPATRKNTKAFRFAPRSFAAAALQPRRSLPDARAVRCPSASRQPRRSPGRPRAARPTDTASWHLQGAEVLAESDRRRQCDTETEQQNVGEMTSIFSPEILVLKLTKVTSNRNDIEKLQS